MAAQNEATPVDLPFDLKLKTEFKINKLLEVNVKVADNMRANFNKQLENLAKEAFKFVTTAVTDGDYVEPKDDTKNIANVTNYFPNNGNFVPGGEVFTNYFAPNSSTRRIPKTKWSYEVALSFFRWISGNSAWGFGSWYPINFWIFQTRDNNSNALLI